MSASLSSRFLADLAEVYATLHPEKLSAVFLSDLVKIYDTLPIASASSLHFLAHRFDKWRKVTEEYVNSHLAKLAEDDPLRCPISLFRTMDYGRLEIAHTRTLAWLLDPVREHGFGKTLLGALLRRRCGNDRAKTFQVQRVESELPVVGSGAKGRLDVLAEGTWQDEKPSGWVLAIEAKVDAWEGEAQLDKYEAWLRRRAAGRELFLIFLTKNGRSPETGTEEWESLSFLELVRIFRAVYGELRGAPGFHFLKFYLAGVLQDVCRCPRNVADGTANPHVVASYLQSVHESRSEVASHDSTR